MLTHHLKIAVRNLMRNKVYSFINIFGLTVGLTCFLLIALYVFDELTYDRFHKNTDSIFRVVEHRVSPEGKESKVASVAFNISVAAVNDLPEVVNATRFSMLGRSNVYTAADTSRSAFYESYFLADSNFFKVFDYSFLDGDRGSALNAPYTAILTEETAKKYFGQVKVSGKTLYTDRDSTPYKITGVIRIPDNSHLKFNVLFSEATLYSSDQFRQFASNDWRSNSFVTYLHLNTNKPGKTASQINSIVVSKGTPKPGEKRAFILQPLSKIHFHSAGIEGSMGRQGNLAHIYIFIIIGSFVLLIACINYMNLATARYAGRSKEIAVRKVAGARQKNLLGQFMTEALLVSSVSLVISIALVKLILPSFNAFAEKQLALGFGTDLRIWLGIVSLLLLVGVLAGLYPAIFQSRLKPILLLRNKVTGSGNLSVRKGLVIFQFSVSIIMIIATIVVYQQLKYIDTKDMGFDKSQLMVVDINSGLVRRSAQAIKTEYERIPGVKNVSVTSRVPGEWKVIPKVAINNTSIASNEDAPVFFLAADENFLRTFEITLANGRNFSGANPGDSSAVLLNESAASLLGIAKASEQLIEIPGVDFSGNFSPLQQPFKARVVGIVKDFNFRSLREKIAPMVIAYWNNPVHNIDYFTAKVETKDYATVIKQMQDVIRKIDPQHLFEYNFLDKQWELFYREDEKRKVIFFAIALTTILVACLGLFGLATYTAQQRTKEIGIRKVLGANMAGIVRLLSADFIKLVGIAAVTAFPVAWWVMHNWLRDFEYRVSISAWVFIAGALAALCIALLTISLQAIKAARANPIKSLRTE